MQKILVAALAAAVALGSTGRPALADGASSTRNTFFFGALGAAAIAGVVSLTHRRHHHKPRTHEVDAEQVRRQDTYRAYYFDRYGHYPSDAQFREWYRKQYGTAPR